MVLYLSVLLCLQAFGSKVSDEREITDIEELQLKQIKNKIYIYNLRVCMCVCARACMCMWLRMSSPCCDHSCRTHFPAVRSSIPPDISAVIMRKLGTAC